MSVNRQYNYYSYSSAVPKYTPEELPNYLPKRNPNLKTKNKPQPRVALSMDFPFLFLLSIALIITIFLCSNYLSLTSKINESMRNISLMEKRLEELRTENDTLEQSLTLSFDVNEAIERAVNELGMVKAGKDNTIYYDKTESEYVRQYEDIPKYK